MGAGKKQKIGNKYFLGFHLVPAEKIDAIVELIVNRKSLWKGYWTSGSVGINKPSHMGGDEKEGGISGTFDLDPGLIAQGVNTYLQGAIGGVVSAYRGVVSFVARKVHIGSNTGRLPDWWIKMVNVSEVVDGWKADKSEGYHEYQYTGAAMHISLDVTLAANFSSGARNSPIAAMIRRMKGYRNDVRIISFRSAIQDSIERLRCSDDDYEELAQWVEALPSGVGVTEDIDLAACATDAAAFFNSVDGGIDIPTGGLLGGSLSGLLGKGSAASQRRKVAVYGVRSAPIGDPSTANADAARATLDALTGGVETYLLWIQATGSSAANPVDNTPDDGYPVMTFLNQTPATDVVDRRSVQWVDLNAVHHIRHLLITAKRGGPATSADIGTSFDDAADQCFAEGFFLSVPYSDYPDAFSCIREIERHIDAAVYQDVLTGKWEIKLIRPDYTVSALPLLDSSLVTDWSGLEDQAPSEPPNQLTVTYTKRDTDEPGSETRTNVAAVRRRGRVVPAEAVDYPFITYRPLAVKVCLRDVGTISSPVKVGALVLKYLPAGLHRGAAVRLTEPLLGLSDFVVRITEITETDGVDNSVTIKVAEDKFFLGETLDDNEGTLEPQEAQAATPRLVQEAPYWTLVMTGGQTDTDAELALNENTGFLMFPSGAPTPQHLSADVAIDSGSGYVTVKNIGFEPVATLQGALTRAADDVTVLVSAAADLDEIQEGDIASIGTEIVRIDDMVISGGYVELTIGRGCLDTVPVSHAAGESIMFWGPGDPAEDKFIDGQVVDVKMVTHTRESFLEFGAAPVDSVTFASRAIRPYPPGQFKVNGSYDDGQSSIDFVLTWAHRDRLTQTTPIPEDHDDSDIGPEAGTEYTVTAEAFNNSGTSLGVYYTSTGITGTTHDYPDATARPASTAYVDFIVTSVRDTFESWQSPRIRVVYDIDQFRMTPETDRRITPEGDNRLIGG
jgi:hypothetical protein